MTTFSLLTLNCYGVPAPGTRHRLSFLADMLNSEILSAVCLQEVQSNYYRKQLVRTCSCYTSNAYEPFFHAPKGGLLTLSQYPIENTEFVLYEERGLWYTPALADWILHKGILISRLRVGDLPVVIMNTHLTANYTGDWSRNNPFAKHEYNQLQQLASHVRAQPPDALVLVCGDFNIPRGSWLYDSFLEASGLSDPMGDNMQPTLRPRRLLPERYAKPIDFAFVRAPDLTGLQVESRLRLEELVFHGGRYMHVSDHYGVEIVLRWQEVV